MNAVKWKMIISFRVIISECDKNKQEAIIKLKTCINYVKHQLTWKSPPLHPTAASQSRDGLPLLPGAVEFFWIHSLRQSE